MIRIILAAASILISSGTAFAGQMKLCSGPVRVTCLVDGDTIWIEGQKLRMAGYDTPEAATNICGGEEEVALANKATARALELLNSSHWTVVYSGNLDNTGTRELVSILIDGRDLGDILIKENLAREWPDGDEFWCQN